MEISLTLVFTSFVSILIIFKLLFNRSNKLNKNNKLPPGPKKLPLIGNLHQLSSDLPHRIFHKLSKTYGPVMHFQLGELSVVVINSPEAAKEVTKTHDVNFATRPRLPSAQIMTYDFSAVGMAPYGDYWRTMRKIYAVELMGLKRVQSFRPVREGVFADLVRWIASKDGRVIDFTERVDGTMIEIVSRVSIGRVVNKNKEKLVDLFRQAAELGTGFSIGDLYPSVKLLGLLSFTRKKMLKLHREEDVILEEIIKEHKLEKPKAESQEDLVDVLIKFQDQGLELPLTNDNIKAVIMEVLSGGSETSSAILIWAMTEMVRNPEILEKAQEEVRGAFNEKGYVEEARVQELEYLMSVIKETLRVHSALLVPRESQETTKVDGYVIPKGMRVIVNSYGINRDAKHWGEDADVFRPERFLGNCIDYKGNNFEFIPFGAGRRICPGMTFGLANVELPLAMLLYHFNWKLPEGSEPDDLDMTESFSITACRKEHLRLVPIVKRPIVVV